MVVMFPVLNSLKACRSWIVRVCLPSACNYMLIISVIYPCVHLHPYSSACVFMYFGTLPCVCLSVSSVLQDVFGFFVVVLFKRFSRFLCFPLSSSTKFTSRMRGLVQNPPQMVVFNSMGLLVQSSFSSQSTI